MTLMEHLYELRSRLFKAVLAMVVGLVVGLFLSSRTLNVLRHPFDQAVISLHIQGTKLQVLGPTDYLVLQLKVALYVGLLLSCPIWLYQLWSFITPGLHKNERRWAYTFVAAATPLFVTGAVLAYFVVSR